MARDEDYASSSESEDEEGLEWMLGFCQDEDPKYLLRHRFPSKIGGSPAWLDPVDLPAKAQLECKATGRPLNFLLQVYAPVDEEESAFHRTIFVFTTPSQEHIARKGAVRAFRCQLPRDNPFYPPDPPADEDERPPRLSDEDAATSTSRDRWGVVARERGDSTGGADASALLNAFPEMELVVEPEDTAAEKGPTDEDVKRVLEAYEKSKESGAVDEAELENMASALTGAENDPEKRTLAFFQARVDMAKGQVVRYCFQKEARPLWPTKKGLPTDADIPPCPRCGAPRQFEMQVLPHLVHYLGQDDEALGGLDFGTLAVYTCSKSCGPGEGAGGEGESKSYAEEFVWVIPPL